MNKDPEKQVIDSTKEPAVNPDIIDLPRRVIGTPQVVAGYIFILALLALSGTFMVLPEVSIIYNDIYWLKYSVGAKGLTPAQKVNLEKELEEEAELRYGSELRNCYAAMACFAVTGLSLAFGAISLAFFLAFGRKYSLVNTALLPVGMSAGCYFILVAQGAVEVWRNTFLFFLVFATIAIIVRRIVEWVSPIRDESAERRDWLHRSNIARASAASVFFLSFLRGLIWLIFIFLLAGDPSMGFTRGIWRRFHEWFADAPYPYPGRELLILSILFVPMVLGGIATVLFLLRRGRILTQVSLLALLAFEVVAVLIFFLYESRIRGIGFGSVIMGIVPGIMLLYYPYVILVIMLRLPLGRELFK